MNETIIVTIKDGHAKVEAKGFKGASCLKATAEVQAALGHTMSSVPTGEMREMPQTLKVGR